MPLRPYFCREWLIEDARATVLTAFDDFAKTSGLRLPCGQEGSTDADLPALFRAVDQQVDTLIERSGVIMPDHPYKPADVALAARQLAAARG